MRDETLAREAGITLLPKDLQLLFAPRGIESLAYNNSKLVRTAERLAKVIDSSKFHCFDSVRHGPERSDHDDRRFGRLLAEKASTCSPSPSGRRRSEMTR
jgi:hypothetical protein